MVKANAGIRIGQALPGIYENVISSLDDCGVRKILDPPSGFGVLAQALKKKGYDTISLDIEQSKYVPEDGKIVISDLTRGIPFRNDTFDAVLCVEGIEHMHNPLQLIEETYRVLKKGGYLILTTPNAVNVRSRVKFLMRGELFWFDDGATRTFGHISPQFPFVLEHFFSKVGFTTLKVAGNKKLTITGMLACALTKPLSALKRNRMNSLTYLASESLIYLCKKA